MPLPEPSMQRVVRIRLHRHWLLDELDDIVNALLVQMHIMLLYLEVIVEVVWAEV